MKSNNSKKVIMAITTSLFTVAVSNSITINGEEIDNDERRIMVSMGDSYSSGEGIENFYGYDIEGLGKYDNEDYLAHRSMNSWPGKLVIGTANGGKTMAEGKDDYWYFVATSGATTEDYYYSEQDKTISLDIKREITSQLSVFDTIAEDGETVDYVTMTIGGNDMGFSNVITIGVVENAVDTVNDVKNIVTLNIKGIAASIVQSHYLDYGFLKAYATYKWADFYMTDGVQDDIEQAYKDVIAKAGSQANVIVAGYPTLLSEESGASIMFDDDMAKFINNNVKLFNDELEEIVDDIQNQNIHFVSVENEFEGHEAYSEEAYINGLMGMQDQDLTRCLVSAYSIHPNELGATKYAEAVQAKIDEIESERGEETESTEVIEYTGSESSPRDIVLKLVDSCENGEFNTAASCFNPTIELVAKTLGSAVSMFNNAETAWEDMLSNEIDFENVQVISCDVEEMVNNSTNDISKWITEKFSFWDNSLCTDATVYIKYKYTFEGVETVVEERYYLQNYDDYGWRIDSFDTISRD